MPGVLTILPAAIFSTFIPNTPKDIRWLSSVEKDQLLYRLEMDQGSKEQSQVGVYEALSMAVIDSKTWLLCSILWCNLIAASVVNFCECQALGDEG